MQMVSQQLKICAYVLLEAGICDTSVKTLLSGIRKPSTWRAVHQALRSEHFKDTGNALHKGAVGFHLDADTANRVLSPVQPGEIHPLC
jgi:hypothetical protein